MASENWVKVNVNYLSVNQSKNEVKILVTSPVKATSIETTVERIKPILNRLILHFECGLPVLFLEIKGNKRIRQITHNSPAGFIVAHEPPLKAYKDLINREDPDIGEIQEVVSSLNAWLDNKIDEIKDGKTYVT